MELRPNTASASRRFWPSDEGTCAMTDTAKVRMATDTPADPTPDMEDVEAFRLRARAWLAANMKLLPPGEWEIPGRDTEAGVQYARDLMARMYEAGFSGICVPTEYGG